jgi:hypothetical protein
MFKNIPYITWQNIAYRWDYGKTLGVEKYLDYCQGVTAGLCQVTSSANVTLKPESIIGTVGFDAYSRFVPQLHARGLTVAPYLFGTMSVYTPIANNSTLLNQLAENVLALLIKYNLDGINMDIERDGVETQVKIATALYNKLNPKGKFVDFSGSAYGGTDIPASAQSLFRYIYVMCYDMGWVPTNTKGYPHSSFAMITGTKDPKNGIDYKGTGLPMWSAFDKAKIICGLPLYLKTNYLVSYPADYRQEEYLYYLAPGNITPEINEILIPGRVSGKNRLHSFLGANELRRVTRWLIDNGYAGVMVFALGYDYLDGSDKSWFLPIVREIGEVPEPPTPPVGTATIDLDGKIYELLPGQTMKITTQPPTVIHPDVQVTSNPPIIEVK